MRIQNPRVFVVDDDRAVLALAGTGMTCLDVLRALRSVSPHCEAVLMTGYESLDAAINALKQEQRPADNLVRPSTEPRSPGVPAPLIEVERAHIVRTLELARGNKAVAARLLGVSRRAFYRQLERHGLHRRVPMARRGEPAASVSE